MTSSPLPGTAQGPHCEGGAGSACPGRPVAPHRRCLAHLAPDHARDHFESLRPGDDIDHRGTAMNADLLTRLLRSVRDPATGKPRFGTARFEGAGFVDAADFAGTVFTDPAYFNEATFHKEANFSDADFEASVFFGGAKFIDTCDFTASAFRTYAGFRGAEFGGEWTSFADATFHRTAGFLNARFGGRLNLTYAWLYGDLVMRRAEFTGKQIIGPLVCAETVRFDQATFNGQTALFIAAPRIDCSASSWEAPATLRVRYASLTFSMASFAAPLAVMKQRRPFGPEGNVLTEDPIRGVTDDDVRVVSIAATDASLLRLVNVDLSRCGFAGAINLDQTRIEGACRFASTPTGLTGPYGFIPFHWTRRRTLVDEWRIRSARPGDGTSARSPVPPHEQRRRNFAVLAATYRDLRKSLEDAKDEPGAADFYYGEMEMRRHSHSLREAERWLLQAYWLLSGYGLRASRALGWLALAMMTTVLLLMAFGLPDSAPKQEASGTVPSGGGAVTFEIDKGDPENPTGHRFTAKRFDKALRVTLNSVVFRSSGQDMTTTGEYVEMASRFAEPVLLGLGALAIRGRLKR
ncbi:pentapeptide repeat-containing protein [Streptomyces sp. NPDC046465]|uniref:pentapeptide repeat-containing protein n=1 Tax=Streptomyces sp. NPDC046465 TaxID=3155810 RepID=UPI00340F5485